MWNTEKLVFDIVKTSHKHVQRMTSLGRPQDVSFEPLLQMHFIYNILNFVSPSVYLKNEKD